MLIEQLFSLEGKVAVAVGAGGVLAGEMARGFAGAGADVVIVTVLSVVIVCASSTGGGGVARGWGS